MSKILNNAKEEIIELNGKIININKIVKTVATKINIKDKKDIKTLEKFGFEVASKLLIEAGESTTDDSIIAGVIAAAIIAGVSGMSGGIGTLAATYVTTATVTPIIKGALAALNPYEIKAGKSLAAKAETI